MKNYQVKLHIDQSIQSVTQKYRRIYFHLRKGVDKELTNLENEDIIEPVTDGPTEWISPCHAVPKTKQPGKLRVCVDMRAPNKAILRTRHIIPTIEDLVVDLNGAKYFFKTRHESRISSARTSSKIKVHYNFFNTPWIISL
jgi:hypothetical protein